MDYSKEEIAALIDGKLEWSRVQEIMRGPRDADRFEKYVEILQKRVPWKERILLPLTTHLYIVQKGKDRIVKCDCGHEFGDYRINWKINALIYVRDTEERLDEIYPGMRKPDPEYGQLREYICPGCGTLLEVESLPRGCWADFEWLPDLDSFYRDWLKKPLPDEKEFVDKTLEAMKGW